MALAPAADEAAHARWAPWVRTVVIPRVRTALARWTEPDARGDTPARRAARTAAHGAVLLPLLVTVLLLAAPLPRGSEAGSGRIAPADIASALLVLWCLIRVVRERRRPLTPLAAAVLALPAAAVAVAVVTAADPGAALPGLVRYLQVFVLVPGAVLLLLRDARDFRAVTGALVVLALVQGAVGVHQYATGTGALYMGESVRAVGTFGPTDVMGMATVVGYGLLAAAALALRPPTGAHRLLVPAATVAAGALTVPLALSFSRGVWIATAAGALVMLVLTGLRRAVGTLAVLAAAGVVLVGGLGVGSEQIAQRLGSITQVTAAPDRSVNDRYTMWAAAVSMWREEPVTGVGLKGFPAHRDGHASIALSSGGETGGAGHAFRRQPLLSPHNMYLLILSEQGLIGLVAFAGSWGALLIGAVRRLRRRAGAGRRTAADCGLAAVGLMVWQTVDFLYADIGGPSTVLTGIVLGLAAWWALAPVSPAPGAPLGGAARDGAAPR
ncbi:O-antigen ligase family protein [Streptomyces sp. NPDC000594]|uniref:O-antigen ligase family protein n=1 Tax=Streptomyces sp. NPDC000594 TaxID=3154261 RepID=UPI00331F06DA